MVKLFSDWLIFSVLGFEPGSKLGQAINFFIYDSIKILLLLFVMISIIGFLRSFLPQYKIKNWLVRKKSFGNLFAALFGSVTPFCSCSSIPIFLGFLRVGIPLGVTFSFLITSPLINEYLVVLMLGFFGWKITLWYVLSGICIGVITGIILGRMRLERYISQDITASQPQKGLEIRFNGINERVYLGIAEARIIVKRLWVWILLGVGIGSLIHNYIPQETIQSIMGKAGNFSVPIATLLGVPLYGSCAAIVPIAVALFRKGIPLGTALAFMMAISALSFPEAVILKRAMKLRLIAIFFGVVALAIIFTGYLFNLLQAVLT